MAIQNEPTRITIPFADSGTKNSIPDTQPSPSASQAASWTDGFPAQCSLPLSAGGIPPARADFNGIFNRITQSERFTQEGGVWLWSSAVDYAASRMVRGSDGNLYLSVAQSGPNVGGAVDPTTDSGTYWVKLPSMTDIAAQNFATQSWVTGQGYATQTWVNSLSVAAIYLDENGDDSNDGKSAASAVQTFAKAVELATKLPAGRGAISLIVASGTYNGDFTLDQTNCILTLTGDVALNGSIILRLSSNLTVSTTLLGSKLTIRGSSGFSCINCSLASVVKVFVDIRMEADGGTGVGLDSYSFAYFEKAVDLFGTNNAPSPVNAVLSSCVLFGSAVTVHPSFVDGIGMWNNCNIRFAGILIYSDDSITSGSALSVLFNSSCYISGAGSTIKTGTSTPVGVTVDGNSTLLVESDLAIIYRGASNGYILSVGIGSVFERANTDGLLYLRSITSDIRGGISTATNSLTYLTGTGDISIDAAGTFQVGNIIASGSSILYIGPSVANYWGSSGPKFLCNQNSVIYTGGRTADSLPGTTPGTAISGGYVGS